MNREHKLLKNTFTYMVANFGSKILLLIIYPVYTYYMIPEDLGTYDLIINTLTLLYPIIVFSINDALFRWLLDHKEKEKLEIIAIGLKIAFRNLIFLDLVYVIINLFLNIPLGWVVLGILNLGAIYPIFQQISRGLGRNKLFAFSGLLYAVSMVICNFIFVMILQLKIYGLLLSQVLAYLASCAYLFFNIDDLRRKWWKINISDKELKKNMVSYSLLLIPNSSCWWIMNAFDRYLIRFFLNSTANGIYSVSYKFPSIMNMITSVFSLAWQEQAIQEFDYEQKDAYFTKIHQIYYQLLFSTCLILIPVTKWFTLFCVQTEYQSAWKYSAALYLGSIFLALSSFLGTGYLSVKNTKGSMITSLSGAIINICFDLILLPIIGLEAASIATLLGNFFMWITRWFQCKKYFTISIKKGKFVLLIFLNLLCSVIIRRTSMVFDGVLVCAATIFFITLNKEIIIKLLHRLRK